VHSIERIHGGRNSQVFRFQTEEDTEFLAKIYFQCSQDDRDRINTEFSSLTHLWKEGFRSIPRPVAVDKVFGCAIFEYVEGKRIGKEGIQYSDIDEAIHFLHRLYLLRERQESACFPNASGACFSMALIIKNINERLARFPKNEDVKGFHDACNDFVLHDFMPVYSNVMKWCRRAFHRDDMSWNRELKKEERTLSPSDFGFHNCVRKHDGTLVFLDFEYFGWDDPAKMVSDFLLHPGMQLSQEMGRHFIRGIQDQFDFKTSLTERLPLVYPLFGLKWCLIFLNEFVSEDRMRRGFAAHGALGEEELYRQQLEKARQMLHRVQNEYEEFPYYD
jgi:hypothetical protein